MNNRVILKAETYVNSQDREAEETTQRKIKYFLDEQRGCYFNT